MNPFVLAVILTRVVGVLMVVIYLPYTVFSAVSVLFGSRSQYMNGDWWMMGSFCFTRRRALLSVWFARFERPGSGDFSRVGCIRRDSASAAGTTWSEGD